MRFFRTIAAACAGLAALIPAGAGAAEPLQVLCGGAAVSLVRQFAHDFERTHGRAVVVTAGTAGQIRDKLAAGANADVVIVSAPILAGLATAGSLVDGTRVDVGKTGIGVGIATGSMPPDISTTDAFKRALLAAPAIASTDPAAGASSGIYFAGLLEKLGIADAVKPKETLVPGGFSCELVASGKATLCVQNISEIVPVKGVTVAGPLPTALQTYITYSAAVVKGSADAVGAGAFIADITSPANAARWSAAGFEPATPK